mgnify:CR=1 FL=1
MESFLTVVAERQLSPGRNAGRVPVLLIVGYAAAGKSHLVNALLGGCASRGLAAGLIVHRAAEEFGITTNPLNVGLAALYEEVHDFGSGCLCCSPQGEMTRLLAELATPATRSCRLDVLMIRTGPLAAPLTFAKSVLCSSDAVSTYFALHSIVAVVDPALAPRHLMDGSLEWQARSQLAAADLVLLNPRSRGAGTTARPTVHAAASEAAVAASAAASEAAATKGEREDPECEAQCAEAGRLIRAIHPGVTIERLPLRPLQLAVLLARCFHSSPPPFSFARAKKLDPDLDLKLASDWELAGAPPSIVSLVAHDRRLSAACAVEQGALLEAKLRALCENLICSGKVCIYTYTYTYIYARV